MITTRSVISKAKADTMQMSWHEAWTISTFKIKFFTGWILLFSVLSSYPYFFSFIQKREGVVLNDWLLAILPSIDVSKPILAVICVTVLIGLSVTIKKPGLFLVFLWSYLLLNVSRIITITLVPLNPPIGLMVLADPIAFPFYGDNGINKDLFYSGHTGSLYMIYLLVEKKWEKIASLIGTILVGILLLIQHIHYTLDVLAAPVFVYFIVLIARRICQF